MTTEKSRYERLVGAIARKNTLPRPRVVPVGLEVRTMIGFSLRAEDELQQLLNDRKGASAYHVVWEYKVRSDRLNEFTFALAGNEKELFDKSANAKIRYLGTYVVKEDPQELPVFVTTWGCGSEEDARTVARGPWTGPVGAEQAFKQLFSPDYFNYGKAQITTQGLAAAADLSGG
jgi:hypothetical protein